MAVLPWTFRERGQEALKNCAMYRRHSEVSVVQDSSSSRQLLDSQMHLFQWKRQVQFITDSRMMVSRRINALLGTWDGKNTQHWVLLFQPSKGVMLRGEIGREEREDYLGVFLSDGTEVAHGAVQFDRLAPREPDVCSKARTGGDTASFRA